MSHKESERVLYSFRFFFYLYTYGDILGFPASTSDKEFSCQCRRYKKVWFDPWVGKVPWRRAWQPTPVFLPGESHGQRNLAGYSLQGRRELDMTEVTEHAYLKTYYYDCFNHNTGFSRGPDGKESACNMGDLDLIPGLGRSPGEGNGYLYLYFGLHEGTWQATVHGVAKSWSWLSNFHFIFTPLAHLKISSLKHYSFYSKVWEALGSCNKANHTRE